MKEIIILKITDIKLGDFKQLEKEGYEGDIDFDNNLYKAERKVSYMKRGI